MNKYLKNEKQYQDLPRHVIGDPDRLQQVANNII